MPWLELVAEDILEFKPRVPFRGHLSDHRCADCAAAYRALLDRQKRDEARGEQSAKYAAEVLQVRQTWAIILGAARETDEQQRRRRGH